jgi:hypothetical protein
MTRAPPVRGNEWRVERFRDALVRQLGAGVRRRCYAVVAVGLERLVGEEVTAAS